jgi:sugar lactone lactonase YvrE
LTVRTSRSKSVGIGVVAIIFVLLLGISPEVMAFTNGQTAITVIGQSNFTSGVENNGGGYAAPAANAQFEARGIAFNSQGDLWVADTNNNRVVEYVPGTSGCSAGVLCTNMAASIVIGQKTFGANGFNEGLGGATANSSSLYWPFAIAFDLSGNLWVADALNNRILEFTTPFSDGEAASVVIGQSSFAGHTADEGGSISAAGLSTPSALAFDSSGDLWVADEDNSRVLEYVPGSSGCSTGHLCTGMAASLVIGQSSFTTGSPGYFTAKGMYEPYALAIAPNGGLWVADSDDARVLGYAYPFSTYESATVVLGEPNFTSQSGSLCGGTVNATGMCGSQGMTFDSSGDLWVSDSFNNRVLEFVPGTSGCAASTICTHMAASVVIGQSTFTTSGAATTATGIHDPDGVAFDPNGNLWVSDDMNNRVLEYQGSGSTSSSSTTSSSTTSSTSTTSSSSTTSSTTTSSSSSTISTTTSTSSSGGQIAGPPVCPSTSGGTYIPVGATFTDQAGNTWTIPGGVINGGTVSSYFFPGPISNVPPPMWQGWGGSYGTYAGQQGWIITFYCSGVA